MKIKINGKEEEIENKSTLLELVKNRRLIPEKIVVEHNMKIISKENLSDVIVNEDDSIEIVSFVGGG